MRTPPGRTVFWVGCYLVLALGPLGVLFIGELPPSRGFWIEFSVALGFIALAMLALQFVLTARFRNIAAPFGLDTIIQFHREAGLVAAGFVLLHPVIIIVSAPAYLEYIDPRVTGMRAILLIAAVLAMGLIVFLTLRRQPLGVSYEWWRLSHGFLGVFVVVVALAHVFQIAWYVSAPWQRALWIGLTGGALLLLGHVRIGKPLQMRRRPYRVLDVRAEGGRTWTLALAPVGHAGMTFQPGQFGWLTLGPSPFSMQQHPFSFSSSAAASDRIEFTIRELGDFSSTIREVKKGTPAFVEGPYGALVPDFTSPAGLVLVAGGVGIAPMMSMLRTLHDRADRRPVLLIYGSRNWEEAIFREELQLLTEKLALSLVFVLANPEPGRHDEHGFIREEILEKHFPADRTAYQYFVCGPVTMMDMVERYLDRRGIPPAQIHSERFDIA